MPNQPQTQPQPQPQFWAHLAQRLRLSLIGIRSILRHISTWVIMATVFTIFLPILVLTSGLGTYWSLLTSPNLNLADKFQTLEKIYLTGFQDPLILCVVILQALTLAILIKTIARQRKFDTRAGAGSVITTFLAGIGLGCPACGTSILIPFLSTFLTSGVIALAELISALIYSAIILVNLLVILRLGWVYSQLSLAD